MNKEDTKVLAVVECALVWDRIYEKGYNNKTKAIDELYEEEGISTCIYDGDCPFCQYFKDCSECLWPGYDEEEDDESQEQCWDSNTKDMNLFQDWYMDTTSENAKAIRDMILKIEF